MNPNKINSENNEKKFEKKYGFFRKIKSMARNTKNFLKNHFPSRTWGKPQEKNKGPKI